MWFDSLEEGTLLVNDVYSDELVGQKVGVVLHEELHCDDEFLVLALEDGLCVGIRGGASLAVKDLYQLRNIGWDMHTCN